MTDTEWGNRHRQTHKIHSQNPTSHKLMKIKRSQKTKKKMFLIEKKQNRPVHNMLCINRNITSTNAQKMHSCEQKDLFT